MTDYEKLLEYYDENCKKLKSIHKEINDVKYFGLCQSTETILWNLVHEIAMILEVDEDELGLSYWEDTK
jgi:hypothetical protein